MTTLRQDFVYALRVLAARPGFTAAAALTLALGIAGNTTIYSLIRSVLLQPLPYPRADRLVSLWTSYPESKGQPDVFSPLNYLDVAAQSRTLAAVGAYDPFSYTIADSGQPEYLPGLKMTASLAAVMGVEPQLGRWFTKAEDEAGDAVVVLSDSLWRSRFAAARGVVGRTVVLNSRSFTILGVLPPHIGFPAVATEVYSPISFGPAARASRTNVFLNVVARMRDGVDAAKASAELRTLAASFGAADASARGISMGAVPLQESIVGSVRPMLLILWAAVGFMLAVGCANVANLLMAHAAARQREFAIRRSLGASNGRLVRQLLTESVTLAALGGGLGLALAGWAVPEVLAHLPKSFPQLRLAALDGGVLWFTLAVSAATGVLFGLAPAVASIRRNVAQALRESDRGARGVADRRFGQLLVVGEVAAVLLLLVGAVLVMRSLARLSHVDPGFRTQKTIVWQMFLPPARYANADAQRAFYRAVAEHVETLPGVEAVGIAQPLPFGPIDMINDTGFQVAGRPLATPDQMPQALVTRASAGYFAAFGIPVRRGRVFSAQDGEKSTSVVISETLARRYFPGEDAVGQHLLLGSSRLAVEIVGVVGDVKHINLQNESRPEFYIPLARFTPGTAGLVVRTAGPAALIIPALQRRIWSVDNTLATNLVVPVEELVYASMAPARMTTVLLGFFAGATLVLGLVGVYGVLSYSLRQRTREIGIRLALGASRRDVLKMALGQALGLSAAGVAVGIVVSLALSRYLETLLYGVKGLDPLTYLVVAPSILLAALVAAYIPARRATHIDPATSLRAE